MNYEIIDSNSFDIIGVEMRVSNVPENAANDMSTLWGKFMVRDIINILPNKVSTEVYCVYMDYANDGSFTAVIGCRVNSIEQIPKGCVAKHIPEFKSKCYKTSGKLPDCLIELWKEVRMDNTIERAYFIDYEKFGERAGDIDFYIENAEPEIHVSIK